MDASKSIVAKLYHLTIIDAKDDADEKFERCYGFVQNIISKSSESEAHDALNVVICRSPQSHEEVSLGLLVGILVEANNAARYYRDITYVSRDGLNYIVCTLNQIIIEKYAKLQESTKVQLLWLIREMIKNSIVGTDGIIYNLLRQVAGGDISPKNVWLAEHVLDILIDNRLWLEKNQFLVAAVVYTYLRLIIDHRSSLLNTLRQKEIDFCVSLLRERFVDCLIIGRDLLRLLQNVARVPEFELLWKDIQNNPTTLTPEFHGIHQLMKTRTSRRFLLCRLTPDMERKIVFLTSNVKFGVQRRYQEWFQRQYLSTPESQSLRCDLIRFICGVIHPSNEVLCSDIIPRWAIIGWLLSTCTSNVTGSEAKLALFYDWFFYDSEKDNIMNIEPAILVMYHSMRSHPVITVTLLDFLCRIMPNFYPPLAAAIRVGITTSIKHLLEKRVLQSLGPLFESNKLDRDLRTLVRETFPEFVSANDAPQTIILLGANESKDMDMIMNDGPTNNHSHSDNDPRFSDDDDDQLITKTKITKDLVNNIETNNILHDSSPPKIDFNSQIAELSEEIKSNLINLNNEKDNEIKCEIMEKLIQLVLQEDEFDTDITPNFAIALSIILHDELFEPIFPRTPFQDDEALEDSIGSPLFVIFRNLCQTPEDNHSRAPLLSILAEMSSQLKCVGYLLLYYMKVTKTYDNRMSAYREYVKSLSKDLNSCLIENLKDCQEYDSNMFIFIVPDIYTHFMNFAQGNAELLHLIVSCIDSIQLQDLICQILQANMNMFKKDSFLSILNTSLEWETFEQYCLWQLISAHNIPIDYVLPILPKLEFQAHAEALTSILLLLKREDPTQDMLKHITNREVRDNDFFVVSVLKYWAKEYADNLAELINIQITKTSSPAKRKRQTGNKPPLNANAERMLGHLDQLRQNSKSNSFFNQETLQNALNYVHTFCNEAQKTRYSDLFALAEDFDQKPVKKGKTKGKTKVSKPVEDSNSDTDASEEEAVPVKSTKTSVGNRRKRKTIVNSDSD